MIFVKTLIFHTRVTQKLIFEVLTPDIGFYAPYGLLIVHWSRKKYKLNKSDHPPSILRDSTIGPTWACIGFYRNLGPQPHQPTSHFLRYLEIDKELETRK